MREMMKKTERATSWTMSWSREASMCCLQPSNMIVALDKGKQRLMTLCGCCADIKASKRAHSAHLLCLNCKLSKALIHLDGSHTPKASLSVNGHLNVIPCEPR